VDLDSAAQEWQARGFVILPGFVPATGLRPALGRRDRFAVDEWAGIDSFPFRSAELSLLAVSNRVIDLAETLLADTDLRISSAESWAKYTGAADYHQPLHRDYLNHTLMVPADDPRFRQLEGFIYLVDVPEDLGPPSMLSRTRTTRLPAKPNWYPRETTLTLPRGARYTIHLAYRPARAEWGQRMPWTGRRQAGKQPETGCWWVAHYDSLIGNGTCCRHAAPPPTGVGVAATRRPLQRTGRRGKTRRRELGGTHVACVCLIIVGHCTWRYALCANCLRHAQSSLVRQDGVTAQ
jgi:hypothetical protein